MRAVVRFASGQEVIVGGDYKAFIDATTEAVKSHYGWLATNGPDGPLWLNLSHAETIKQVEG